MLVSVRSAKSSGYIHKVKYGCDLLGPGILESTLSQEYIGELG